MYVNLEEVVTIERKKRESLEAKVAKLEATVEYLAMMTDVDIDRDNTDDSKKEGNEND